ncbi:hypothetical protein H5410_062193 [Solanum commersonii]|uniref:DUF7746 domain-containing protein n=1 Tax=Solanum commersonii TaxID=4109 RepID=A0A9J5W9R2_SOLCO|nr:hypothetical protein H5410_062193 [Solanum commersonii]
MILISIFGIVHFFNLDGLTDRKLTILFHRMLMYATIYKSVRNTNRNICKMIIVGFTGQLRGWWDNYMSVEAKSVVINATSDAEGVDNLRMALVKNREDTVYTLVLTILEHFNGRFTNQYEIVRSLLNGLRCRHLGEFRWYKDTYLSRVMELPENGLDHLKAKFIDDLPLLFAERLIRACTQEGINLCNELKLSRRLKIDKLRERSQLGDFCTQFGLLDSGEKDLDAELGKNMRNEEFIEYLIDLQRIDLGKNLLRSNAINVEKLKSLDLDEKVHDKIYSFLYTSGSKPYYDFDSSSEEDIDLPESSNDKQPVTMNACRWHGHICSCENDEFYILQYQFDDLNVNTITSDNVIELLKEVTDNDLHDKIIQFVVNNSAINTRLAKQPVVILNTSFDDLKGEIENLKNEIKALKQNQMICDHRLTQIDTTTSKGKTVVENANNTLEKSVKFDPKKDMMDPLWVTKGRRKRHIPRGRGRSFLESSSGSSYGS